VCCEFSVEVCVRSAPIYGYIKKRPTFTTGDDAFVLAFSEVYALVLDWY